MSNSYQNQDLFSIAPDKLPLKGCYLVLSGPGGGKTTLIVERIAHILQSSQKERYKILALTFTNKAAHQMHDRLFKLFPDVNNRVFIGTFHNFASHILKSYGHHIGLDSNFPIYDTEDTKEILKEMIELSELPDNLDPINLTFVFSRLKSRDAFGMIDDHSDSSLPKGLVAVYQKYQSTLERLGAVDFGDLILKAAKLLKTNPFIASLYYQAYEYILVDEFQDTTPSQYKLLKIVARPKDSNIFAVADEDQLIYEWNEARLETLNLFIQDFNAVVDFRTLTYRCPRRIVKAANFLIKKNRLRFQEKPEFEALSDKPDIPSIFLYSAIDHEDEALFIQEKIDEFLKENKYLPKDIAVIARQHYHLSYIEKVLSDSNIMVQRSKDDFISTEQGRFILSILRLAVNGNDPTSFRRIINIIAPSYLGKREEWAQEAEDKGIPIESVIESLPSTELESEDGRNLREVLILIEGIRQRLNNANQALNFLKDAISDLRTKIPELTDQFDGLVESINRLIKASIDRRILRYGTLPEFLDSITFLPQITDQAPIEPSGAVSLLTCHQAKGLEFPVVFLVALERGIFPDYRSERESHKLEEERRIFYVSITRTKEILFLTYANRRPDASGNIRPRDPSPFIAEIPDELLTHVNSNKRSISEFGIRI